ncbi:MAG: biopolymer transporter ExbD [Deltaproteobacteria bacterium]|nr:biopolymer transporter ExbD [Deltaproteobacteria bacterium]
MRIKLNNTKKARIDIIPLIDVIFLLLIFFIYTMLSMSVHKGIELNLPKSAFTQSVEKENISISIKSDDTVYINKKKIKFTELKRILSEKIKADKDATALLFADKEVKYRLLFQVIDKIKEAGIKKISLQAEEKGE